MAREKVYFPCLETWSFWLKIMCFFILPTGFIMSSTHNFCIHKKQQLCISLTTISFFLVFILSIRFERIIMKTLSAFILDLQESYMHRWPEWESDLHTIFPWYISSDFTSACFLFVLLIWWKRLLFFIHCSGGKLHIKISFHKPQISLTSALDCNVIYECSGSTFS